MQQFYHVAALTDILLELQTHIINPARDRFSSSIGRMLKPVHGTSLRHKYRAEVLLFSLPEPALPTGAASIALTDGSMTH